jgi:gliding motility-associated-like protein
MLVVNASYQSGDFYNQIVNNLCSGTTYEFSVWVINVVNPQNTSICTLTPIRLPNITMQVETLTGNVLQTINTGAIQMQTKPTWDKYSSLFTVPTGINAIRLRLINKEVGGCGNDLVLDDISFRVCGPSLQISFNNTNESSYTACEGSLVNATALIGSGYITPSFQWQMSSDGINWQNINESNKNIINLNTSSSGQKFYRVLSSEFGNISNINCRVISNTLQLNVINKPPPLKQDENICLNTTPIQLESGATGNNLKYLWTPTNTTSPTLNVSQAGKYQVKVTSPEGCEATRTINVLAAPQIDLGNDKTICDGESIELIPIISNGSGSLSYRWSTGETTPKISVKNASTYELTVDNGSCSSKASVIVIVNKPPTLKQDENICLNTTPIQLESGATGNNLKYLWTPTNTTSPTLNVSQAGKYQVKVTSPEGCEATRTINVLAAPQIDLGNDKTICDGESIELIPNVNSTNSVSYLWASGQTTKSINVSKTGIYKLTVTLTYCSASDSVRVTVNPSPKMLQDEVSCIEKPLSAGIPDNKLTYFWEHSSEKTHEVNVLQEGVYKVKVTNQFGCTKTRTITVNGPCNTRIFAPDIFTPNGDSTNDIFKVFMLGGTQLRLDVYNRWGTPIYSEEGTNPQWDGKVKGEACQNGYYPYILKYKALNTDTVYEFRGSILLER